MNKLGKIPLILTLFAAIFYFGIIICLISPWLISSHKKYSIQSFDSHSGENYKITHKEIKTGKSLLTRGLKINFRFKIYHIDGYDNLFQTAPYNSGIRMELSPPSTLALIADCGMPWGVRGFIVSDEIDTGRWYKVMITINKFNHLSVFLDGRSIVNETLPFLHYSLSDIAAGTGFDGTRMFNGKISDFNIEAEMVSQQLYAKLNFLKKILGNILIFMILFNIAILIADKNSILLLIFFIYSFGLITILPLVADKVFSYNLFNGETVVFNDWALKFVFSEKSRDLLSYIFMTLSLFLYYFLFFVLTYTRKGGHGRIFALFFAQKEYKIWQYLFIAMAVNLLIIRLGKIYHGPYLLSFQYIIWVLSFFASILTPLIRNKYVQQI